MTFAKSIPVDEIKSRANLIEYISKHYPDIKMKRSGNVFIARCPFHNEETGSFAMWNNGTYKCFGCHEHGDVITFVQKMENIGFREACKMVAENVGVSYVLEKPNPTHEAYKDMMNDYNRRYWKALKVEPVALSYLKDNRKLTDETIDKFRIGYVPMDEYKVRTDMGNISGRIAYPILEHKDIKYAKCVGMGYRALGDVTPKYINDKNKDQVGDPLNGVFIKGNSLYGYPFAYKEIKKLGYGIITEGYMDVISMHQAGIENVVGSLGTAITEVQADILRSLTDTLVMFLDGDGPGVTNMVRVLPMLLSKGFKVKMMLARNNMDPADICVKFEFDKQAIESYIACNTVDAVQYVITEAASQYERIVIDAKRDALNKVGNILNSLSNDLDKDLYKSILYKKLDI